MGFITDFFKQREDASKLSNLVRELGQQMDDWIKGFENDGTPPNNEQSAALEDEKITEIIAEYESKAPGVLGLEEGNDLTSEYCVRLVGNLQRMKGDLYRRFSDDVVSLEARATNVMRNCVKTFENKVEQLTKMIPLRESAIIYEHETMIEDLTRWIESRYPEGVAGLDNYDDTLPDGLPSWSQFQENVNAKFEELKAANAEAIPAFIEKIKEDTHKSVEEQINEAIKKAVDTVKVDLSDDEFRFLSEDASSELRNELINLTEEYGQQRLAIQ